MRERTVPSWLLLSAPIVVGICVMVARHAAVARWGVHLAAGLLGLALFGALKRVPPLGAIARWCLAGGGLLVLASTLLAPGIEGMRRWHELGPLRVHPSALLVPTLLVFATGFVRHRGAAHAVLLAVQAVHCAQPDAGQATALGCGALGMLFADERKRARLPLAALYSASIAVCWLRADPLPPAPFVEDIVSHAFELGVFAGMAAALSLALLVASPVVERAGRSLPATYALVGYFAGSVLAPVFGEFPVPLLGFGTSPVVGAFVGLATLTRLRAAIVTGQLETQASRPDASPDQCQKLAPAQ